MAIDSSMFAVDLPAGSYSAGDVLPMVNVYGPANVRSGRGSAILKRIFSGLLVSNGTVWRVHVKNSDWVDEAINFSGYLDQTTCMDVHSGMCQFGNDCPLTENSGWQVYAECVQAGTSTVDDSLFCLIDIDYPQVSAITNPDSLQGIPTSIILDVPNVQVNKNGTLTTANWKTINVDYFKAGSQYCLQEISVLPLAAATTGFIALSNAAGMGGLSRIIPVNTISSAIRATIEYASKLVKGPMDISMLMFGSSATSGTLTMVHDFVKRA